jgi:hypothetical protein
MVPSLVGTVEKHECIDVNELHRARAFTEKTRTFPWACFRWPWLNKLTVDRWMISIEFSNQQRQRIPTIWSQCHFGGLRPWFRCPLCTHRAGRLYKVGPLCACRKGCNLRYASQRRGEKSRRYLQALKLRLRLGGVASLAAPFPERPRRMHRRTYKRLKFYADWLERDLHGSQFNSRETDYSVLVSK